MAYDLTCSRMGGTDVCGEWYPSQPPVWELHATILPFKPWSATPEQPSVDVRFVFRKSSGAVHAEIRMGGCTVMTHGVYPRWLGGKQDRKPHSLKRAKLMIEHWLSVHGPNVLRYIGATIYQPETAVHVYRLEPDGRLTPFCSSMKIGSCGGLSTHAVLSGGWEGKVFLGVCRKGHVLRVERWGCGASSCEERDEQLRARVFRWTRYGIPSTLPTP